MKEETKVRKAAEESGQCNMRTVTTEDNPYKVAGDILFASSEVESDFRSVDLYGSSVRRKKEDAICSRFHLENESGTGDIAVYQTMICIWNIVIRCRVHVLDLLKLIIVGRGGVSVRLESVVIAIWQREIYPFVPCIRNHIHQHFLLPIIMG